MLVDTWYFFKRKNWKGKRNPQNFLFSSSTFPQLAEKAIETVGNWLKKQLEKRCSIKQKLPPKKNIKDNLTNPFELKKSFTRKRTNPILGCVFFKILSLLGEDSHQLGWNHQLESVFPLFAEVFRESLMDSTQLWRRSWGGWGPICGNLPAEQFTASILFGPLKGDKKFCGNLSFGVQKWSEWSLKWCEICFGNDCVCVFFLLQIFLFANKKIHGCFFFKMTFGWKIWMFWVGWGWIPRDNWSTHLEHGCHRGVVGGEVVGMGSRCTPSKLPSS